MSEQSKEISHGQKAPNFELLEPKTNTFKKLNDLKSDKATVVMFICNHCPYVILINSELSKLAAEYQKNGVSFIGINSNDAVNYPQDSPEKMIEIAENENYTFPYLYDETQNVAKEYNAACTPDIFVYDGNLELAYHGEFDDARPSNGIQPTGNSLRQALDEILRTGNFAGEQKPSIGCSIKWKA